MSESATSIANTSQPDSPELLLLILCSPSGAGKTTLARHLLERFDDLRFSISHTTRAPRANEQDGVHYHFVDRATFEREVAEGLFAEHAEVHGNLYGTSKKQIGDARAAGMSALVFDIDHQGARQIRAALPGVASVFILPPSMDELRRRLVGRATDAPDVIERRLTNARDEIKHYGSFDYLVINDDLEEAKQTLESIVRAERARRGRQASAAEALLRS